MKKETVKFAEREGKDLFLTHYISETSSTRGCVIFVFGGGFAFGSRDSRTYQSYFSWLCDNGYDVASIDYRLGLSREYNDYGWKHGAWGQLKRYQTSIEWARDDMLSATAFVLKNAAEWNVDSGKIIACGSSAGAITCLMAENAICNGDCAGVLPSQFNYAGIISFAGAIFSMKGHPKWDSQPCPMMLFHGNSDRNVPYKRASMFRKGLWGSSYIVRQLKKNDWSYYFYDGTYQDHSLATTPMNDCRSDILSFLRSAVERKERLQIHNQVRNLSIPKRKTKFLPFIYLSQKG